MDGIDVALFSIRPQSGGEIDGLPALDIELISSCLEEFPGEFKRNLKKMITSGNASLQRVCLLNTALGEVFANACLKLMRSAPATDVHLIGSHGQTIWHVPTPADLWGVTTAGTLQLGEPAVIAARTGVPVVADFRPADIAYGGQGAPLVSFADQVLFGRDRLCTGVLNMGGIANLTVIDESGKAIIAFDTGPANVLIDRSMMRLFGKDFDKGGEVARSGAVNERLLQHILSEPYFKLSPPKTTGRELFGDTYADAFIEMAEKQRISNVDLVATLTAATAGSIVQAYTDFVRSHCEISRLILGGGGADNATLVDFISADWPHPIKIMRHEDCGISTKFKEALLFALLAYTTYHGVPNNVRACTGASRSVCLGKICQP